MKFLAIGSEARGDVGIAPTFDTTESWFFAAFAESLQFNQNRQIMEDFMESTPTDYFGGKVESPGGITIPADRNTAVYFYGAVLGLLTDSDYINDTTGISEIYAVPIEENFAQLTAATSHFDGFPSSTVWVNSDEYLRKITGLACNELSLTSEQGAALVMLEASMVGGNETLAAKDATMTEADLDKSNYYAFAHGTIKISEAAGSLSAYPQVTSFNMTIARNLKTDPVMDGNRFVGYWALGELAITGSITAHIDSNSAKFMMMYMHPDDVALPVTPEQYDTTLANRFCEIEVGFDTGVAISGAYTEIMFVHIPRAVITSATKNEGERGQTTITFEWQALSWYNDESYISPELPASATGNTLATSSDTEAAATSFVGTYIPVIVGFRGDSTTFLSSDTSLKLSTVAGSVI